MQGSILYIDGSYGFLQGADQNRYYFTDADWRASSAPQAGQAVTFQPDGQNAREVSPQVAQSNWGAAPLGDTDPKPFEAPPGLGAPQARQQAVAKAVYNIPLAIAAAILLISLMLPYGKLFSDYRFTDTGLKGFYFMLPVALIAVSLLGQPRVWPFVVWIGSVIATGAAVLDDDSLFSRVGEARERAGQLSAVTGGLFNARIEDEMRQKIPGLTDYLNAGFYLHAVALLATGMLVLFFKYEVRASRIQLHGLGTLDTGELAQAGRNFVAGAERLTGQSVPSGKQTGHFLRSFLTFDHMIAPTVITINYYVGLVLVLFAGIVLFFGGLFFTKYGGLLLSLGGLVLLVCGPLWIRLWAEFLIVIFKIHGHLRQIDEKTKA